MPGPTVALVVQDPDLRLRAARAFDEAPRAWTVRFSEEVPPDADVVVYEDPQGREGVKIDPERPQDLLPEVQARLERANQPKACRTAIVTGVPGSGVTSVALHLAAIWARRAETCFLDLDRSWSCADRLGLAQDVITWAGTDRPSDGIRLASVPIAAGLRALVAPVGQVDVRSGEVIDRVPTEFERVVIDGPYGHLEDEAIALADSVVVVLSPCLPHAHRTTRILHRFATSRLAVVTNRLGPGGETTRAEIESILGRKLALELPTCPGLRDAEGKQHLASLTWSRWGRALERLSRALERV
jgi:hypothetical protein